MRFSWEQVESALDEAVRCGTAVVRVSDHDVLLGINASAGVPVSLEPIIKHIDGFQSPLISSHAVALLNPDLLIPPPLVWPVKSDAKHLLMEEELILAHAIDLDRFTHAIEDDFRVVDVDVTSGIRTERRGEGGKASARFINEALYGYAAIESVVAALRDLHDLTMAALTEPSSEAACRTDDRTGVEIVPLESPSLDKPAVVMDTKDSRYRIERKK